MTEETYIKIGGGGIGFNKIGRVVYRAQSLYGSGEIER